MGPRRRRRENASVAGMFRDNAPILTDDDAPGAVHSLQTLNAEACERGPRFGAGLQPIHSSFERRRFIAIACAFLPPRFGGDAACASLSLRFPLIGPAFCDTVYGTLRLAIESE